MTHLVPRGPSPAPPPTATPPHATGSLPSRPIVIPWVLLALGAEGRLEEDPARWTGGGARGAYIEDMDDDEEGGGEALSDDEGKPEEAIPPPTPPLMPAPVAGPWGRPAPGIGLLVSQGSLPAVVHLVGVVVGGKKTDKWMIGWMGVKHLTMAGMRAVSI